MTALHGEANLLRPSSCLGAVRSARSAPAASWPPFSGDGVDPAEAVSGRAQVAVNGHDAPLAADIVLALRSKWNWTALTTRSLADELGIETEDLDHALAGQPVPAETVNVLQGLLDARP